MSDTSSLLNLYPFESGYQDTLLECLGAIPGYQVCEPVDRALLEELMRDFPEIDLLEQLKAWRWYRADNPTTLKNPRSALRRWMMRAREFGL